MAKTYRRYSKSPTTFTWKGLDYKPSLSDLWIARGCKIKGFNVAKANGEFDPHAYIDHPELYRLDDGKKTHKQSKYIVIAHLYDIHVDRNEHQMKQEQVDEDRKEIQEFSEKYNLEVHFLDDTPSWYNDRCTVVLWKDKE